MDKRRFNAYRRRLIAVKKARRAYVEAEIEHIRFRENGSTGELPKRMEAQLRRFIDEHLTLIELTVLKFVNEQSPRVEGDHYDGDGCLPDGK